MPVPIYLLKKDAGTAPFPQSQSLRTYGPHWCPIHMDFVVDDIEAARERLMKAGAREESPITNEPYGKLAMYRDIFGHRVCLIEFSGKGYGELTQV